MILAFDEAASVRSGPPVSLRCGRTTASEAGGRYERSNEQPETVTERSDQLQRE